MYEYPLSSTPITTIELLDLGQFTPNGRSVGVSCSMGTGIKQIKNKIIEIER